MGNSIILLWSTACYLGAFWLLCIVLARIGLFSAIGGLLIKRTPKEEYEKMLIKQFNKDIKDGNYTIEHKGGVFVIANTYNTVIEMDFDGYLFRGSDKGDNYINLLINGENYHTKEYRIKNNIDGFNVKPVIDKMKKDFKENRREIILQEKMREDELYINKLKELKKIKPLDADLQANFKKAQRILDISGQIIKLTKELKTLRK